MNPIIVIPSRLASTRLPRKALADIGGMPMIARVATQALKAGLGRVIVAAGDNEILDAVASLNSVEGVLTDSALASGSDRVHAALEQMDPGHKHDVVINLQGDLPGIDPEMLHAVLEPLKVPQVDIGTLVAPIGTSEERQATSVVKVACSFVPEAVSPAEYAVARALYFSRQSIPWGDGPSWHHVGVYAWRREALARFVSLPPSGLEQRESLEQLRALEAGMRIDCARIGHAPIGVDTTADLERVRREIG